MISGRSSDTTYDMAEKRNPGKYSTVVAAPPRIGFFSRTSTD